MSRDAGAGWSGPDRPDRPDRLWQVDGGRPPREPRRDRHRCRPGRPAGDGSGRAGHGRDRRPVRAGAHRAGRRAGSGGARAYRVLGSGRPGRPRGDRPSCGPTADPGRPGRGLRTDAPAVVLEAIRVVDGGYADDVDEIWVVACSDGRPAVAPGRSWPGPGRRGATDRRAGRPGGACSARGHARHRDRRLTGRHRARRWMPRSRRRSRPRRADDAPAQSVSLRT